jgi:hypothetical protein
MNSIRNVSTFSQEDLQKIKFFMQPGAGQAEWIVRILSKALHLNEAVIQTRHEYKREKEKLLIRWVSSIPNVSSYDFDWLARTVTVWFDNIHSKEYEMDAILGLTE